jgi:hypothetical protein
MSVLIDEDNVMKIEGKGNRGWATGSQELADEIGLNLKKLKMVSNKFMAIPFMIPIWL